MEFLIPHLKSTLKYFMYLLGKEPIKKYLENEGNICQLNLSWPERFMTDSLGNNTFAKTIWGKKVSTEINFHCEIQSKCVVTYRIAA